MWAQLVPYYLSELCMVTAVETHIDRQESLEFH